MRLGEWSFILLSSMYELKTETEVRQQKKNKRAHLILFLHVHGNPHRKNQDHGIKSQSEWLSLGKQTSVGCGER